MQVSVVEEPQEEIFFSPHLKKAAATAGFGEVDRLQTFQESLLVLGDVND